MTTPRLRTLATVGAVLVTTAAMCNKDSGSSAPASDASVAASAASATSAGPGLPSDFPLPPGLSACRPIIIGPEVRCEWSNINGHAMFTFFHAALPKAGYTVDSALETPPGHYMGVLKFEKGKVIGSVLIPNTDLEIALFTRP